MNAFISSLKQLLTQPVYQAYSYSYPHKTAYRPLDNSQDLHDLWLQEDLSSLFLYVHIPFCSMRCGFCNLFTLVKPHKSMPDIYLDALSRQIDAMMPVIEKASFARYAIGGGTPTFLTNKQLERLFNLTHFAQSNERTPIAIESSPETIDDEKIALLAQYNVSRISMGVQSFTETEVKNLARKQDNVTVAKAVNAIRDHSSADLNLDLIYGVAGQTLQSWQYSLDKTLDFSPEEIYLYPLYVRNKTGLGKLQDKGDWQTGLGQSQMLELYRAGRDKLKDAGYQQISMRMFRKADLADQDMPVYSCQEDGMMGLGAGARSYTQSLHYSSEYSVGRQGVKEIIQAYDETSTEDFGKAWYGVKLNIDEQKRRFIMQSLLIADGLSLQQYQQRFGGCCLDEFSQLTALLDSGLAKRHAEVIQLTPAGIERSDAIGPWFVSASIKQLMSGFDLT